jgi:hypothetical protein
MGIGLAGIIAGIAGKTEVQMGQKCRSVRIAGQSELPVNGTLNWVVELGC